MKALGTGERTRAANEADELLEDRFVRYVALPSLQKMASYRVVQSVWCAYVERKISSASVEGSLELRFGSINEFGLSLCDRDACDELVKSLRTPRCVEKELKESLREVFDEVVSWMRTYWSVWHRLPGDVFAQIPPDVLNKANQCDPGCIVWLADGKVDMPKTAARMTRRTELHPILKFVLLSEYCLEDELKAFPLDDSTTQFIDLLSFKNEGFLALYWLRLLQDGTVKVPDFELRCPEVYMAMTCDGYRWPAFKYFWHRMSDEDQTYVAKSWLRGVNKDKRLHQDRILSEMSAEQQRSLLSEIGGEIVLNFVSSGRPNAERDALWAWARSAGNIKRSEFEQLCQNLQTREKQRFFALIWDQAPKHLKSKLMAQAERTVDSWFSVITASSSDFALLCKYFPHKSPTFWRNLVFSNAERFANHAEDPTAMHQLINLALPNPDDLASLKKIFASSEMMTHSCLRLMGGAKFRYIDLKLQFCISDQPTLRDYMQRLLQQTRTTEKCFNYVDMDKWNDLSDFIDRAFASNPALADAKRKQLLSAYVSSWPHRNDPCDLFESDKFDTLVEIIENMFQGSELNAVKNSFVRSYLNLPFHSNLTWRDKFFSKRFFQRFLLGWALLDNESAIATFKTNLPIDEIFTEFLVCLSRTYRMCGFLNPAMLSDADYFLEWYGGSVEQMNKYKAWKVASHKRLEIFKHFSRKKDAKGLMSFIKWAIRDEAKATEVYEKERALMLCRPRTVMVDFL